MSEEQVPYNAGDAQAVAKRQKSQKTRELQKRSALRAFLGTAEGRMWFWDVLSFCGVFHSSFSVEALLMAFNEGKRNVGNFLISEINQLSPEFYMKMAVENQEKEKD